MANKVFCGLYNNVEKRRIEWHVSAVRSEVETHDACSRALFDTASATKTYEFIQNCYNEQLRFNMEFIGIE